MPRGHIHQEQVQVAVRTVGTAVGGESEFRAVRRPGGILFLVEVVGEPLQVAGARVQGVEVRLTAVLDRHKRNGVAIR